MLFLFYVSNNAIAVSTATVLIASVFQHHFGESDYDVPFPKVTVEIDTQAFGPFISNLEQRKDDCHFQQINCQDDQILVPIFLLCFSSKGDQQFLNIGSHPDSSEV